MAYKKAVTPLLVAFLAGASLIPAYTQAGEPELYFFPKNKWVVKDTGNNTQKMNPVCSVTNELNNGYILEMTGSKQGFDKINIDFRQSAFTPNMKYEVQYTIPGLDRAIVTSQASTVSKVSSDISNKSAFAEGLSSAGVLDIQIRENEFRVYLTGLKASMPQFDDCVAPAAAVAKSKIQNMEDAVLGDVGTVALQDSAPELHTESAPAQAATQASASARPNKPHKRYTEILAEQLKQESEKYKPVEEKAEKAASDEGAMMAPIPPKKKETKHSYHSPAPVYNVNKKKVEPIDMTQAEKSVAEIEPASGVSSGDAAQMRGNVAALEQELASLRTENAALAGELSEATQAQPVSAASGNFVDMRNKISSMEKELISLREKNQMLDEELKLALQESEKERLSVSSDNWNLERATMRYNEAERQIARIGRQLQTARATCEHEKSELEQMLFDPKLTEQSQLAKLAALEKELDSAKSDLYRQQRQYEERIKLLESQLQAQ
ncbi:MAG: hypothetical protein ACTHOO_03445 [Alcanivorax sp.]